MKAAIAARGATVTVVAAATGVVVTIVAPGEMEAATATTADLAGTVMTVARAAIVAIVDPVVTAKAATTMVRLPILLRRS